MRCLVCAAALVVLLDCHVALAASSSEERLIGWQGETYKPDEQVAYDETGNIIGRPLRSHNTSVRPAWVQTISWKPRAFIYHNFLSDQEAGHILKLAKNQMKRSTVVGSNNSGVVDNVRTSAGTFLRRNQDPVVAAIEERLAIWTQLPASHQEDMQVLRYGPTNKYGPHIDGLERVATVLMYIIEPEEGGETAFTNSEWAHPDLERQAGQLSPCARGHVAYRPRRGDALLFFDTLPDYVVTDHHSMHTGCPVVKGLKWNAVKWIHGEPFRPDEYERAKREPFNPLPDPGICVDLEPRCKMWAEAGECKRNPGYMIGSSGSGLGGCRKSCDACVDCAAGDAECLKQNRERGGFMAIDDSELQGLPLD